MKLFMFVVGGRYRNANIELHDVRFSIGDKPEDCYPDLRAQWWGEPKSLHLDCWGEVNHADGHDVALVREKSSSASLSLFFVNLGGYDPQEFGELHKNVLIVAANEKAAKARALTLVADWRAPHKDNIVNVETLVNVSDLFRPSGYVISLREAAARPFTFTCAYVPIGK